MSSGDTVWFEIDCGWITRAVADPGAELKRFADRIIDWEKFVPLFRETKAEHIVTEHDNPADWRRFAQRSIEHIKALGL
ncbi:hypothetical protein ACEQ6A_08350 [Rhizobium brockwellii]|uniref:hypothetical protein n=1 Tax=Rhizobium brockwellii TaxID=3019932 RepID=UPI003F9E96BF